MSGTFKIKTPHAAFLVWNYNDRVDIPNGEYDASGVKDPDGVERAPAVIISTLSCVSLSTSKAKGQPEGTFNAVLAPYKNWTSTLTAGSWCCIMMSNEPIQQKDLHHANPKLVKMFGRIETVRCETNVNDEGARQTLYYVSGIDWGSIFNSQLYIDNLIAGPNDVYSQGNSAAVAIRNALFGKDGSPMYFSVQQNLTNILDVMGKSLSGYSDEEKNIGRLAKTIYDLTLPKEVSDFFQFKARGGGSANSVGKLVNLTTGTLVDVNKYHDYAESSGFIDPFTLQGTHTIWQVLMENSNPVLNEMFCDLRWENNKPVLKLFNRIKPFTYKQFNSSAGKSGGIESRFQNVEMHSIDTVDVISVNAGTNWRDKYNFIEIKPQFQEFAVVANWYKQKSQIFDRNAFNREGFRPLIFDTKQFPTQGSKDGSGTKESLSIDWSKLEVWGQLLREWYFGTHRMLNGTLVMHGSTDYIGVGNNIRFSADLLNPNPNINADTRKKSKNQFILAHVESVSHSFSVSPDGARSYRTTINFVRGIVVNDNNVIVGDGVLDQFATKLTQHQDRNKINTVSTSESADPDFQKINGT